MALSAVGMKIISFFSILIVSILFTLLPLVVKFKNDRLRVRLLSLGNALAGGVFLGGGFSHLLPESAHSFEEVDLGHLPIGFMLCVGGFFLVFFLEKVIFNHGSGSHNHSFVQLDEVELRTSSEPKELESQESAQSTSSPSDVAGAPHPVPPSSKLVPILLTLVLSIHSIIAGFTLGVQTSVSEVTTIFIAIISHKWTESFALGVSLAKSNVTKKVDICKFLGTYSIMTPLGLVLGAILSYAVTGHGQAMTNAVVSGIAAGTFIYIALVDILLKEFDDPSDKYLKFLFCLVGYGLITGSILLFDDHDH